jgi:hypothetical protein
MNRVLVIGSGGSGKTMWRSLGAMLFLSVFAMGCRTSEGDASNVRAAITEAPVFVREKQRIHAKLTFENMGHVPVLVPNERFQQAFVYPRVTPLFSPTIQYALTLEVRLGDGQADTLAPGQRVTRPIELTALADAGVYQFGLSINGIRPVGEYWGSPRTLHSSSVWIFVAP